jgi:cbb3-type cytochrome oxidase cytochrome c subunit
MGDPPEEEADVVILIVLVLLAWVTPAGAQEPLIARGEHLFKVQGCYGCHLIGKFGTPIGPNLSRVGAKYSTEYLRRWLQDPAAQRPNAHMPKLELDPAEVEALAAFLSAQR